MWIIALGIQMVDPRNDDAKKQVASSIGLGDVVLGLCKELLSINKMLYLIFAIVFCIFVFRVIKFKNKVINKYDVTLMIKVSVAGVVTVIYQLILSDVCNLSYYKRSDVAISYFFYLFLLVIIAFAIGVRNNEKNESIYASVLPLITFVVLAQSINSCKSFKEYNLYNFTKEQVYEVGCDIIAQYQDADKKALEKMDVHVAENSNTNNTWPYTFYVGNSISDTLFRHGVISRPVDCTIIYDIEKNEAFHLSFK